MTSKRLAYVWVWLPTRTTPVLAGRLAEQNASWWFQYSKDYLARSDAIALGPNELPLEAGLQGYPRGMPGCLRDGAPDAWGRRLILNRLLGLKGRDNDPAILHEIDYLLHSGSDRIGCFDFQTSQTYEPRLGQEVRLELVAKAFEKMEMDGELDSDFAYALLPGTTIGGARPKAAVTWNDHPHIAKFSSSTDLYPMIQAEFMAMTLAKACGLDVAPVSLVRVAEKNTLMVKRFDRSQGTDGWQRHGMVSGLSVLELDEMTARYASYQKLCEIIRRHSSRPQTDLHELFGRLVFNILCCNNDDHARNHAFFWDGESLRLTPAYDLCPQLRMGGMSTQAMAIDALHNQSQLQACLRTSHHFALSQAKARDVIEGQIAAVRRCWQEVSEAAKLKAHDADLFQNRLFFHPYAFEGYGPVPKLP